MSEALRRINAICRDDSPDSEKVQKIYQLSLDPKDAPDVHIGDTVTHESWGCATAVATDFVEPEDNGKWGEYFYFTEDVR